MRAAHETATHEENIAENKYDTLGLEAAYLATGQARRAGAIRQAMAHWHQFRPQPYDASKGIQLGALVCGGKYPMAFLEDWSAGTLVRDEFKGYDAVLSHPGRPSADETSRRSGLCGGGVSCAA